MATLRIAAIPSISIVADTDVRIPRSGLLLLVFILSLLGWVVWYLPAKVLVARLPTMTMAGATVTWDGAAGRVWHGQANWHWRGHDGLFGWHVVWHGFTPGTDITLTGSGLDVAGWVSKGQGRLEIEQMRLTVPLALVLDGQTNVAADGTVSGRVDELRWRAGSAQALKGVLHYDGGSGRWKQQTTTLPVMDVRLFMQGKAAKMTLTDTKQKLLADATVDGKQQVQLEVYRAFSNVLGMGDGKGSDNDVVFKASQPLAGWGL